MHPCHSPPKLDGKLEGTSTRRGVQYHEESKRYVFCDDLLQDTSCSICMESLGKVINLIITT